MKKVILDKLDEQQVKDLLQEKTPDGVVNTIPELIEKLGEIPDGIPLDEYIRQIAEQSAIDPDILEGIVGDAVDDKFNEEKANIITPEDRVTDEELADFVI